MRKCKYLLLFILLMVTGCLERDTMDNIQIKTTSYPIQYITERIYGEHSTVERIYPNGSTEDDVISDKLLKDYSKTDLFIFNGLDTKEQDYRDKMLSYNQKLKLIDVAPVNSMVYEHAIEELWLDPMNLLAMANHLKKRLKEYIDSAYLTNDIDKNYQQLKQDLIQLDADYREMAERANKKTIVVSDDAFLFLEKYGITVISLEENENLTEKAIHDVYEMIDNNEIQYLYTIHGMKQNDTVSKIQKETGVEFIELHNLFSKTEEEDNQNADYFTLMRDNLEKLKKQLYL